MPSSGRSAASDVATSSASRLFERVGIARAADERAHAARGPPGARCGHFDDSHDAARMPVLSTRGTTKPDPFSGWRDRVALERQRDGRRRRVRDLAAEPRELRVAIAQRARAVDVRRRREDDRACARSVSPPAVRTTNGPRPVDARRRARVVSRTMPAPSARDERAHHLAQAAGQRPERAVGDRGAVAVLASRNARSRLPCVALGVDEARKQRADRQPVDVAGVDAGEQRLGEIGRRLRAEAPRHERADRFVRLVASRAGRTARRPCAACPATRTASCVTNGPMRVGMPRTDAAGSGCRRPPRWM